MKDCSDIKMILYIHMLMNKKATTAVQLIRCSSDDESGVRLGLEATVPLQFAQNASTVS